MLVYLKGILNEYSPTVNGDRRIVNITVRHLLQHSAGWDRDRAGDPVFWKVGKHMNVEEPVTAKVLIQYMMGKKLQFAPGKNIKGVYWVIMPHSCVEKLTTSISHMLTKKERKKQHGCYIYTK